ncbi:MAG TPA: ATP-binding protein [Thermodesulfobacteriota bacterium]|nr:ATP-binding protein [Thermodesulfobacteriota bacterium]
MFRSIRFKLTGFVILLLIFTTIAFFIVTVKIQDKTILNEIIRRAETSSKSAAAVAAYSLVSGDSLGLDHVVFKGKSSNEDVEYMAIVDQKMRILAHSDLKKRGEVLKEAEGDTLKTSADGTVVREITFSEKKIFEIHTPILFKDHSLGIVFVGVNRSILLKARDFARERIFWLCASILIVGVMGVIGISILITRSIQELASGVEELEQGKWGRPLRVYSRDELGKLTESFNKMSRTIMKQQEEVSKYTHRLRTLSENAPFGMVMIDKDGTFEYINPRFREIFGYDLEDIPDGRTWFRKAYPDPAYRHHVISTWTDDLAGFMAGGKTPRTFTVMCNDGTQKIINFIPVQLETGEHVVACEDITELKRSEEEKEVLQEQLRQSQKVEAVGRLAGGIAHDFNNLLTVIKGYSELSRIELKEGDTLRGNIDEIQKATERAAGLTRQLLAFSRRQVMEMKVLDSNTLLRDLEKMLRRVIGEEIDMVIQPAGDLGRVRADVGQLEQIIINLAVNAKDAMPSGGKLTIETANVELDASYARSHVDVKPGHYVMLSVSDTGIGMTPEVRERIFEPFFTTKEIGKGTGLGLSTVYGIVKQSKGHIWVYSTQGKGTAFKIYLPRVDDPMNERREEVLNKELPLGNETILIVEDEEEVRKLAGKILERQGYRILETFNGDDALAACEKSKSPIHLMLADVVMPGMSGSELAELLKPLYPEIKILYMSGYTDDAIVRHGVLEKGVNYIQKPFTMEGLARKVREVLDQETVSS